MPRYIDADALKHELCIRQHMLNADSLWKTLEIMDAQPTADVAERKRGKWIKNDFYEDALMCSCCRAYLGREDWSSHNFYFCYHCGAFMEGMDLGPDMRGGGGNVE